MTSFGARRVISHTRSMGPRGRKTHIGEMSGPRDLQSQTWYPNRARLRSCDHYVVVVKIEGKEVKDIKQGKRLGRVGS